MISVRNRVKNLLEFEEEDAQDTRSGNEFMHSRKLSILSHSFENLDNFLSLPGHIFPSLQNERVESDELRVIFQILLNFLPIQSGPYLIVSPQCDKKECKI